MNRQRGSRERGGFGVPRGVRDGRIMRGRPSFPHGDAEEANLDGIEETAVATMSAGGPERRTSGAAGALCDSSDKSLAKKGNSLKNGDGGQSPTEKPERPSHSGNTGKSKDKQGHTRGPKKSPQSKTSGQPNEEQEVHVVRDSPLIRSPGYEKDSASVSLTSASLSKVSPKCKTSPTSSAASSRMGTPSPTPLNPRVKSPQESRAKSLQCWTGSRGAARIFARSLNFSVASSTTRKSPPSQEKFAEKVAKTERNESDAGSVSTRSELGPATNDSVEGNLDADAEKRRGQRSQGHSEKAEGGPNEGVACDNVLKRIKHTDHGTHRKDKPVDQRCNFGVTRGNNDENIPPSETLVRPVECPSVRDNELPVLQQLSYNLAKLDLSDSCKNQVPFETSPDIIQTCSVKKLVPDVVQSALRIVKKPDKPDLPVHTSNEKMHCSGTKKPGIRSTACVFGVPPSAESCNKTDARRNTNEVSGHERTDSGRNSSAKCGFEGRVFRNSTRSHRGRSSEQCSNTSKLVKLAKKDGHNNRHSGHYRATQESGSASNTSDGGRGNDANRRPRPLRFQKNDNTVWVNNRRSGANKISGAEPQKQMAAPLQQRKSDPPINHERTSTLRSDHQDGSVNELSDRCVNAPTVNYTSNVVQDLNTSDWDLELEEAARRLHSEKAFDAVGSQDAELGKDRCVELVDYEDELNTCGATEDSGFSFDGVSPVVKNSKDSVWLAAPEIGCDQKQVSLVNAPYADASNCALRSTEYPNASSATPRDHPEKEHPEFSQDVYASKAGEHFSKALDKTQQVHEHEDWSQVGSCEPHDLRPDEVADVSVYSRSFYNAVQIWQSGMNPSPVKYCPPLMEMIVTRPNDVRLMRSSTPSLFDANECSGAYHVSQGMAQLETSRNSQIHPPTDLQVAREEKLPKEGDMHYHNVPIAGEELMVTCDKGAAFNQGDRARESGPLMRNSDDRPLNCSDFSSGRGFYCNTPRIPIPRSNFRNPFRGHPPRMYPPMPPSSGMMGNPRNMDFPHALNGIRRNFGYKPRNRKSVPRQHYSAYAAIDHQMPFQQDNWLPAVETFSDYEMEAADVPSNDVMDAPNDYCLDQGMDHRDPSVRMSCTVEQSRIAEDFNPLGVAPASSIASSLTAHPSYTSNNFDMEQKEASGDSPKHDQSVHDDSFADVDDILAEACDLDVTYGLGHFPSEFEAHNVFDRRAQKFYGKKDVYLNSGVSDVSTYTNASNRRDYDWIMRRNQSCVAQENCSQFLGIGETGRSNVTGSEVQYGVPARPRSSTSSCPRPGQNSASWRQEGTESERQLSEKSDSLWVPRTSKSHSPRPPAPLSSHESVNFKHQSASSSSSVPQQVLRRSPFTSTQFEHNSSASQVPHSPSPLTPCAVRLNDKKQEGVLTESVKRSAQPHPLCSRQGTVSSPHVQSGAESSNFLSQHSWNQRSVIRATSFNPVNDVQMPNKPRSATLPKSLTFGVERSTPANVNDRRNFPVGKHDFTQAKDMMLGKPIYGCPVGRGFYGKPFEYAEAPVVGSVCTVAKFQGVRSQTPPSELATYVTRYSAPSPMGCADVPGNDSNRTITTMPCSSEASSKSSVSSGSDISVSTHSTWSRVSENIVSSSECSRTHSASPGKYSLKRTVQRGSLFPYCKGPAPGTTLVTQDAVGNVSRANWRPSQRGDLQVMMDPDICSLNSDDNVPFGNRLCSVDSGVGISPTVDLGNPGKLEQDDAFSGRSPSYCKLDHVVNWSGRSPTTSIYDVNMAGDHVEDHVEEMANKRLKTNDVGNELSRATPDGPRDQYMDQSTTLADCCQDYGEGVSHENDHHMSPCDDRRAHHEDPHYTPTVDEETEKHSRPDLIRWRKPSRKASGAPQNEAAKTGSGRGRIRLNREIAGIAPSKSPQDETGKCISSDHSADVDGMGRSQETLEGFRSTVEAINADPEATPFKGTLEPIASSTPVVSGSCGNEDASPQPAKYVIPARRKVMLDSSTNKAQSNLSRSSSQSDSLNSHHSSMNAKAAEEISEDLGVNQSSLLLSSVSNEEVADKFTPEYLRKSLTPKTPTSQPPVVIGPQYTPEQLRSLLSNQTSDESSSFIGHEKSHVDDEPTFEVPPRFAKKENSFRSLRAKRSQQRRQVLQMSSMGVMLAKCQEDDKKGLGWGRGRVLAQWTHKAQSEAGGSAINFDSEVSRPSQFDSTHDWKAGAGARAPMNISMVDNLRRKSWNDSSNASQCGNTSSETSANSPYVSFQYTPTDAPSNPTGLPLTGASKRPGLESVTWDWKYRFREAYFGWTTPYIDTHCHLDFLLNRSGHKGSYAKYREENADTFPPNYKSCVAIFCNPKTWRSSHGVQFHKILDEEGIFGSVGCHPKCAPDFREEQEHILMEMLRHPKIRALGEIGLDYSHSFRESRDVQISVFKRQMELAKTVNLPLVIHCRDAEEDCIEQLIQVMPKDYKIHRHCFTGNWEEADHWLRLFPNSMIGLTPLVTHRRSYGPRGVAQNIPLNRLLLETDSPYFVPHKVPKGAMEFSHPGMAVTVAAEVAMLRNIDVEQVLAQCLINSRNFYNLP